MTDFWIRTAFAWCYTMTDICLFTLYSNETLHAFLKFNQSSTDTILLRSCYIYIYSFDYAHRNTIIPLNVVVRSTFYYCVVSMHFTGRISGNNRWWKKKIRKNFLSSFLLSAYQFLFSNFFSSEYLRVNRVITSDDNP